MLITWRQEFTFPGAKFSGRFVRLTWARVRDADQSLGPPEPPPPAMSQSGMVDFRESPEAEP